jgi:hypothetical protein
MATRGSPAAGHERENRRVLADRGPESTGWHELQVRNPSFLVEKLGAECSDLQGLRELTVNSLEAISALGLGNQGRVVWDLDWERFDASGGHVRKLSVIDTGTGMTADEMRAYINQLASSGREQSRTANFGVGAKIAAGSRNPDGLEYRSWHHGAGALVRFKRHRDGRWGLEPQTWPDGHADFWRPLADAEKPWLLRGLTHGTQVVLLGESEQHDTTQAPKSVVEGRRAWIVRYLNARFLRFPDGTEVLVREDSRDRREPGPLMAVRGQRHHLEEHAEAAGTLELSDATAHWWVLDEDHRGRRREAGTWISTGHAAAMLGDELYDLLPQTRGGYGRLQDFGIRFGYERVVLYLEARVDPGRLEANTARSMLLLDHEPLPWLRWAEEFAANMPAAIRHLQERAASAEGTPRQEAIRSRVAPLLPLYRLSRYRPARGSPTGRESDSPATAWERAETASSTPRSELARVAEDTVASEELRPPEDSTATGPLEADLPDVAWISWRDGTRAADDLEDLAARYHPARHELTINADFRAIRDLISYWRRRYESVPGSRSVIEAQVTEWCEQVLVEVVLAARNSQWDEEQLAALLSPTSLSAALLPRQFLHAILQKRLAQKLGPAVR